MKNYFYTAILALALLLSACTSKDEPSISLYVAMQRGDIEQISRHIRQGADMEQLDTDGSRPLHVAARQGRIAIVRLLLKASVDVNSTDNQGHSAIYYAILAGRTRLADLLQKNGATFDASKILLAAARTDVPDRDAIAYLIAHDADTESKDAQGDTPLITAIRHSNHRLVRHLVTGGANVNTVDAHGKSALSIANEQGLSDIAQLLKRQGAENH